MTQSSEERLRRWRLILGGGQADGICTPSGDISLTLSGTDQAMDNALSALYDSDRSGGLGSSSPKVARWLGDIRTYFPTSKPDASSCNGKPQPRQSQPPPAPYRD